MYTNILFKFNDFYRIFIETKTVCYKQQQTSFMMSLYENQSNGILYSKCQYNNQITTDYFSLTPRKIEKDIYAYDLKFINRVEARELP